MKIERVRKLAEVVHGAAEELKAMVAEMQEENADHDAPKWQGKVGIVVGHGRRGDAGAQSVGMVHEWAYNKIVGEKLAALIEGSVLVGTTREHVYSAHQEEVARILSNNGCECALELHFNAAGDPSANGHEWLYHYKSLPGGDLADAFSAGFSDRFPSLRARGPKELKPGDNGFGFVKLNSFPKIICEPFFGSNIAEWDFWGGRHKDLAEAYLFALVDAGYVTKK